ncbi:MAG: TolC family protein [Rhodanobacteraceae bacterium]|jgi:outer membrane protein TolC|nr:TolC family protein [Rhodanobacteraceae bacterium]
MSALAHRWLALALAALAAPASGAETLEQAWQAAEAADHGLAAARADTAAAREGARAAQALRLPTLQAQAARLHVDTPPQTIVQLPAFGLELPIAADRDLGIGGVVASMPLFTSGRIANAVEAARAGAAAAAEREGAGARDLRLQVAQRYFDVLKAERLLAVTRDAQASLQAHARDVGNLHARGYVPKKDVLAVEVMLADMNQQVRQGENRLDLARAAYNRQLGRALDAVVVLAGREPSQQAPGELAVLTRDALARREEIKALGSAAEAAERLAASKRAENLPSLALVGGYARWDSDRLGTQGTWLVGATLSWTFFDGGRVRAEAGRYAQQAEAARERGEEARSLVELDVRRAWLALGDARDRLVVAHGALAAAAENLRVARSRYREGLGTNADVLDAERENSAAETRYQIARYDAAFAEVDLDRALGRL